MLIIHSQDDALVTDEVVNQNDAVGCHKPEDNLNEHMISMHDVVHEEQQVHDIEEINLVVYDGELELLSETTTTLM